MSQLIMVIGNNETLLEAYRTLLTAQGYEVYIQSDFGAGYSAALAVEPRLIVVDVLMDDGEKGLELVERLRAEASPFVNIPLIVSSTGNKFNENTKTRLGVKAKMRLIPKAFDTSLILAAMLALLTERL